MSDKEQYTLDDLIGIPFVDGGRSLDGCDCWGLVEMAFMTYGIVVPDYKIGCYESMKVARQISKEKNRTWMELNCRLEDMPVPSLIVMMIDQEVPTVCNHLATYVGKGRLLHTSINTGSYIDRVDEPCFVGKIEGFYEYNP